MYIYWKISPPLDNDIYQNLKVKSIPLEMYSSNGKKIITVRNLQLKEYYLILFGGSEENNFEIIKIFLIIIIMK